MKNSFEVKTEIEPTVSPNERASAIARAVALLQAGEIVALPTETVYGLAADALSAEAVVKIFETKARPRFDPLIVHLPDLEWLERLAVVEGESRALIERLIDSFWPGPLTIVLPRQRSCPVNRHGGTRDDRAAHERASAFRGGGAKVWPSPRGPEREPLRSHQPNRGSTCVGGIIRSHPTDCGWGRNRARNRINRGRGSWRRDHRAPRGPDYAGGVGRIR